MLEIKTDKAPKAIGPYSQGVKIGGFLFLSGLIPIHSETGELSKGNITEQAQLVIDHMEFILKAGGSDLSKVVKVEIFLTDLDNDFSKINEVYSKRFNGSVKPARQTVEVSRLPLNVRIEMSCIAQVEAG